MTRSGRGWLVPDLNDTPTAAPAGALAELHAVVQDELRRADTKATTLVTLVGVMFAGLIALAGRETRAITAVLVWSAMAPVLASIVGLLHTLRARLNSDPTPGSWLYAAAVGPATLHTTLSARDTVAAATEICAIARLARRKYQHINVAIALVLTGLALLASALLIEAVSHA